MTSRCFALRSIWLLTELNYAKRVRLLKQFACRAAKGEVRPRWTRLAGGPICIPKTFNGSMHLIKLTACRQHEDRKSDCCVMMNALMSAAEVKLRYSEWGGVKPWRWNIQIILSFFFLFRYNMISERQHLLLF